MSGGIIDLLTHLGLEVAYDGPNYNALMLYVSRLELFRDQVVAACGPSSQPASAPWVSP